MSFLDSILSKLRGHEVAAISFSQEGEDWGTYGAVLALENGQINIQSKEHFASHSQVESWLTSVKHLPLVIAIASGEILSRKVESQNLPGDELLKLVIPQARTEDFFIQQHENATGTFVSIIRKNKLNQILEIIPKDNQVVDLYLAPLGLITLARGLKEESILLGEYKFTIVGGNVSKIDHVSKTMAPVALSEEESLDQEYMLCYGAGLNYLVEVKIPSGFNSSLALEEYTHKRFLSKFVGYILGGLFLVFLINTFFFFQLSQENEQLVQENSSLLATQEQVEELESYLETYQDLLNSDDQSIFTRFSDELGHSVPAAIQLNQLIVRPLYLEEKKTIEKDASLWIEGVSENAVAYANWIERIKDLDWVASISENTYRQGKFQLKITIKANV